MGFGVSKTVWDEIVQHLCYRINKAMDVSREPVKPIIYDFGILPRITQLTWIQTPTQDPFSRRLVLGVECIKCWDDDLRFNERQDVVICLSCGETYAFQSRFEYRRKSRKCLLPRVYSSNFDKRIHYFRTWLLRLQGKEFNRVTRTAIEQVRTLLFKENTQAVSYWTIKSALRRLGYKQFYNHAVFIMKEIRGTPLVCLTKTQEHILQTMFLDLQDVYGSIYHHRVNMLSYCFLIKKFCELKGWYKMAKVIPLLKSHSRIVSQDQIWKSICTVKQWTFIPSAQWITLDTHALTDKPR